MSVPSETVNNTELQFENFLLKAGDEHYLLASPELTIEFKNQDPIKDGIPVTWTA